MGMSSKIGDAFVELGADDKVYHGKMSGAERRLKKFGDFASRQVKRAAIVTGAALAAFAGLAVKAAIEEEKARNALTSTLAAFGDEVDKVAPKLMTLASAIQHETTLGNEEVLMLMSQIRALGILPGALKQATKGAIGLAAALNLDSNSAARYTALALQGEYTILQRYVPALRTATTAAEKHAIVQDLMNRGYEIAKGKTDTLEGATKQLKNSVFDLGEEMVFAITDTDNMGSAIKKLTDRVDEAAAAVPIMKTAWKIAFEDMTTTVAKAVPFLKLWFSTITMNVKMGAEAFTQLASIQEHWNTLTENSTKRVNELSKEMLKLLAARDKLEPSEDDLPAPAVAAAASAAAEAESTEKQADAEQAITHEMEKRARMGRDFADVLRRSQEAALLPHGTNQSGPAGRTTAGTSGGMGGATKQVVDLLRRIAEGVEAQGVFA